MDQRTFTRRIGRPARHSADILCTPYGGSEFNFSFNAVFVTPHRPAVPARGSGPGTPRFPRGLCDVVATDVSVWGTYGVNDAERTRGQSPPATSIFSLSLLRPRTEVTVPVGVLLVASPVSEALCCKMRSVGDAVTRADKVCVGGGLMCADEGS